MYDADKAKKFNLGVAIAFAVGSGIFMVSRAVKSDDAIPLPETFNSESSVEVSQAQPNSTIQSHPQFKII